MDRPFCFCMELSLNPTSASRRVELHEFDANVPKFSLCPLRLFAANLQKFMAGFLDEIEPLKQAALGGIESRARPRRARTNQGRVDRAARQVHRADETARHAVEGGKTRRRQGHQRRQSRTRSRAGRTPRRTRTAGRAAQGTDRFHAARTPPCARQAPSAHAGDRGHRPQLPQNRFRRRRRPGNRGRIPLLRRAQHARRPSRPRYAGYVLSCNAATNASQPVSLRSERSAAQARTSQPTFSAPTPPPSKSA